MTAFTQLNQIYEKRSAGRPGETRGTITTVLSRLKKQVTVKQDRQGGEYTSQSSRRA